MKNRSGLSFVEFIGCLAALGGGVAIGSMYLGVDIKQIANGALEHTELLDPSIFGWTSSEEEEAQEPTEASPIESDLSPAQSNDELASLLPADNSAEATLATSAPVSSVEQVEMTAEEREAATKAYWDSFIDCLSTEFHGRTAGVQYENWQLLDYLIHRQKGHEQALEAFQKLDSRGVDSRLLAHSETVYAWHESGEELYSRAVNLLTNGPRAELKGPFAQSWQSAATQHRMEEKLVRKKHQVTVGYLNRAYETLAPFEPAFP